MYKLSKRSRQRLEGIEPVLIEIIEEAIKYSPYDFGIPGYGGLRFLVYRACQFALAFKGAG